MDYMFSDVDEAIKNQKEMKDRYGFYIHSVIDDKKNKFISIHSHGLLENFGLLDVQMTHIVDNLEKTHELFWFLLNAYKSEKQIRLKDGDLIHYKEGKYACLRIIRDEFMILNYRFIIPDESGRYPWDPGCDNRYKSQWNKNDEKHSKRILSY